MLKTLNDQSMLARPTTVRDAPWSAFRRILRSTVGSSPCEPPLKTVSDTRSPVAAFQSVLICFRLLSQIDPSGTTVASLMAADWASGARENASAASATTFSRARQDTMSPVLLHRAGGGPVRFPEAGDARLAGDAGVAHVAGHRDRQLALRCLGFEIDLDGASGDGARDDKVAGRAAERARELVAFLLEIRDRRNFTHAGDREDDVPIAV